MEGKCKYACGPEPKYIKAAFGSWSPGGKVKLGEGEQKMLQKLLSFPSTNFWKSKIQAQHSGNT